MGKGFSLKVVGSWDCVFIRVKQSVIENIHRFQQNIFYKMSWICDFQWLKSNHTVLCDRTNCLVKLFNQHCEGMESNWGWFPMKTGYSTSGMLEGVIFTPGNL